MKMTKFGELSLFTAAGLVLVAIFFQTTYAPATDIVGNVLQGEHQLRKMGQVRESSSSLSGGFFLFVGGVSGSSSNRVNVKFAWQLNDGTYAVSSLPLEK